MMSEKVVRRSLVDQVHLFLVQRIQNRSLQPGERLNIEELAREFDVSRTPVREAISRLMQEGLVVQNHNAGPCVASFTKEQELDVIRANMELFPVRFCISAGDRGSGRADQRAGGSYPGSEAGVCTGRLGCVSCVIGAFS